MFHKHQSSFPFINILKVLREVLKTKDEARGFQHFPRDLGNNDKIMFDSYYCINSQQNTAKCYLTTPVCFQKYAYSMSTHNLECVLRDVW